MAAAYSRRGANIVQVHATVNFYPAFVVDHIEHITRIAGVDHVGVGSDFDGINMTPKGLEDVSCYPAITTELLDRGWMEPDVRRVLGENALRVLAAND